tara:strand:- start:1564 stop:1722 length:159 start_codon:yes stop_codon:yes gene_type:complete
MAKQYYFYTRMDWQQEPISKIMADDRLSAAKYFSAQKGLTLKQFLQIYSISR